jgi:hypothetical protein
VFPFAAPSPLEESGALNTYVDAFPSRARAASGIRTVYGDARCSRNLTGERDAEIRVHSLADDLCSVHFSEEVAVYDLSRVEAEELVAVYKRLFVQER